MQSPKFTGGVTGSRIILSDKKGSTDAPTEIESLNPWLPFSNVAMTKATLEVPMAASFGHQPREAEKVKTRPPTSRIPVRVSSEMPCTHKKSCQGHAVCSGLKKRSGNKRPDMRLPFGKTYSIAACGPEAIRDTASKMARRNQSRRSQEPSVLTRSVSKQEMQETARHKRRLHLSKKYWQIWHGKVWGHVSPSVARRYWMQHRCKQVLRAWHTLWWVEQREWKLRIRAECHNRYRLWIKVWEAWSGLVEVARVKHSKMKQGERLYQLRLLRQMWDGWRRYVRIRVKEKEQTAVAVHFHLEHVERDAWVQWRAAVNARERQRSNMELALYYWATELQRKVWSLWKLHLDERRLVSFKMAAATAHYKKARKQRVLRAWLDFIPIRRRKSRMTGVAMEMHAHNLKVKVWSHWTSRVAEIQQLAELEEEVVARSISARLRRMFIGWKLFVAKRQHKCHLRHLAEVHHYKHLKQVALLGFTSHLQLRRLNTCYKTLAQENHTHGVLRRCWVTWERRCEHREEARLRPQTSLARRHASIVLKRTTLATWVEFTGQQRNRKRQQLRADHHFRSTALPKYFFKLQTHADMKRYKTTLQTTSESFRREMLLSMVFYKWWRGSRLSQDVRMLERVAILHWEEKAKQHFLFLWRMKTRKKLIGCQLEDAADMHSVTVLLGGVFFRWKDRWSWRLLMAKKEEEAIHHHSIKLQACAWTAWSKYVIQARERHRKEGLASNKYCQVILGKVLQAWKRYHEHSSTERRVKRDMSARYEMSLQRRALRSWKIVVVHLQEEREHLHLARAHHASLTLAKVVRLWREVAVSRRESRTEKDEWVESARHQLAVVRTRRLFHVWRMKLLERQRVRENTSTADCHYSCSITRKVLRAWWSRVDLARKKIMLCRKWEWFESCRLLVHCYCKWRVQLMYRLEEEQKETLALWQWSHVLEHKVLLSWLAYTRERRRKADRYTQAMCRHRHALLSTGVRQWITVGINWKAQREAGALSLQTQHAEKVLQCVRRCLCHWKKLTKMHRPLQLKHSATPSFKPGPAVVDMAPHSPPSSVEPRFISTVNSSSDVWASLARELRLPDSNHTTRPPPKRTAADSSKSYLSHHLTTPPQPHPLSVEVESNNTPDNPLSTISEATPSVTLPHPLEDKRVQEQIRLMRSEMRNLMELKQEHKILVEQLTAGGSRDTQSLMAEVDRLNVLIQEKEPVLREIAQGISSLVQLCT